MTKWFDAHKLYPTKSDVYLVIKKTHNQPTVAIYNMVTRDWSIMISGQYWVIQGVQYWMEKPKHPTKKDKHDV